MFATKLSDNSVVFQNTKAREYFKELTNENLCLEDILSKASLIFYESYIKPSLFAFGEMTEVQISIQHKKGDICVKVPSVANVAFDGKLLYWSIHTAIERDKLYQELLAIRDTLEKKTDELFKLSRLDSLTGLLNRRATLEDLSKLEKQLRRVFVPIVFALVDIDHFKEINDKHGHNMGDEVICKLAKLLTHSVRESDIVARWGGEEFLLILYGSEIKTSKDFFNRLHSNVAKIKVNNDYPLKISIGVSEHSDSSYLLTEKFEQLIKQADEALYFSKANGRNQTNYWPLVK
ncbi:hypothetical protein BOO23_20820 [Vibrio navarrensis]|nr:hypothetical protein [Vibrio navarrensis]